MAGYDTKKTGMTMSSWDYYIPSGLHSASTPFKVEKDGDLLDPKTHKPIAKLLKGTEIFLLSISSIKIGTKQFAAVRYAGKDGICWVGYIQKRTTKHLEGGQRAQERQEQGVILPIQNLCKEFKFITVVDKKNRKLSRVTGARKNEGLNDYGKEPYADIWIYQGTKELGVSNKGEEAPSLAGGGLAGVYRIDPEYIHEVFEAALAAAIKAGWKDGEVPKSDIYVEIKNKKFLEKALIGDKSMGGPIDFMYIGKMDVEWNATKDVLQFTNGELIPVSEYMKQYPKLYFRIRRRNSSAKFTLERDPKRKDKKGKGLPFIFKGADGIARLVIEKTATGLVL